MHAHKYHISRADLIKITSKGLLLLWFEVALNSLYNFHVANNKVENLKTRSSARVQVSFNFDTKKIFVNVQHLTTDLWMGHWI